MIHTLLRRASIISKSKFHKKIFLTTLTLILLRNVFLYGHVSIDYYGNIISNYNSQFRLNSLESNVSNFSNTKDMEMTATFSGTLNSKFSGNLYGISFSKKIYDHYFYLRYTPGIIQNFVIKSGMNIQLPDSITELTNKLNYAEKFGVGYSWKVSNSFTMGFTLRYFTQEIIEDKPIFYYTDTINYITIKNEITQYNFWRGDIGITYSPDQNFILSIFSNNLFLTEEIIQNDLLRSYSIRTNKCITTDLSFLPINNIRISGGFETTGSFYAGINFNTKIRNSTFALGTLIFHDKYQEPYFAGIISALNFSMNRFSITLNWIKYFSDRKRVRLVDEIVKYGIYSLTNNYFNSDKLYLTLNFALSFLRERKVQFIDVEIKDEIYPALYDIYLRKPFAIGKIINLTNEKLEIRPSSLIKEINEEKIYSPTITINPFDTVNVPFYMIVNNQNVAKRKISQAEFFVSVDDMEPDDKIQKPVLINERNSWDGNVSNLIYFVRSDFVFSRNYSTEILNKHKTELDTIDHNLQIFYKIKILFENFVKNMNYVSDPRSSVEYVQFPSETIKLKGGDCDDLSVCFASILESIGIEVAFVDYKNSNGISHVNLLINTKLIPEQMDLITNNDIKVILRKNNDGIDEIWIPVETTVFKDFDTAWLIAAEKFNKEAINEFGLSTGKVEIIDIY